MAVVRELVTKLSYLVDNSGLEKYQKALNKIRGSGGRGRNNDKRVRDYENAHAQALLIQEKRVTKEKEKQAQVAERSYKRQHSLALRMNREYDARVRKERAEAKRRERELRIAQNRRIADERRRVNTQRSIARDVRSVSMGGALVTGGVLASQLATGKKAFDAIAEYRKIQAGLTALYRGDVVKSQEAFDAFEQLALATPLSTQSIGDLGRSLIAIGKPLDETVKTIERIGEVTFGDNLLLERVGVQYAQAFAKGYADLRDLKPMANANIPIFTALADSLGVTVAEIYKMTSAREITIDKLDKALAHLADDGGQYSGAMKLMMDQLAGRELMVKERFEILMRNIGEDLEPVFKIFLTLLRSTIDFMRKLHPIFRTYLPLLLTIGTAMTLFMFITFRLISSLYLLRGAIRAHIINLGLQNVTLKSTIAAKIANIKAILFNTKAFIAHTASIISLTKILAFLKAVFIIIKVKLAVVLGAVFVKIVLVVGALVALYVAVKKLKDIFKKVKDIFSKKSREETKKYKDRMDSWINDSNKYLDNVRNHNKGTAQNINVNVDSKLQVPEGTTKDQEEHLRTVANSAVTEVFSREMVKLQAQSAGI